MDRHPPAGNRVDLFFDAENERPRNIMLAATACWLTTWRLERFPPISIWRFWGYF
jgi:hypothetical protein